MRLVRLYTKVGQWPRRKTWRIPLIPISRCLSTIIANNRLNVEKAKKVQNSSSLFLTEECDLKTKNSLLAMRAKEKFVEFVVERDQCRKFVDSRNQNRKLSEDFILVGSKNWDGILFSRLHKLNMFMALVRLILDYDDDENLEKFIGKRDSFEPMVNFFGFNSITMRSDDLLALFCTLTLIKERRNIFYVDLIRNIIDEFHRRTLISTNFHMFTTFFETLHRFGGNVFERQIECYANLLNFKSNEFLTDSRLPVGDYGVVCYALALSKGPVDELLVDKIMKTFNQPSKKLLKNSSNIGFICYFLNLYRYTAPLPLPLSDKLRALLMQLSDPLANEDDSKRFSCSDFTLECVKSLLE